MNTDLNKPYRLDAKSLLLVLIMFFSMNSFGQYSKLIDQNTSGDITNRIETTPGKSYYHDGAEAVRMMADSSIDIGKTEIVTFTLKNNINSRIVASADIVINWNCGESTNIKLEFENGPLERKRFKLDYYAKLNVKNECVKPLSGGVTSVHSISYTIYKIIDIDARDRELKKAAEEKEQKRLAEIETKKKADTEAEAKRVAEAEAKSKADQAAKAKAQSTASNNSANQSNYSNKNTPNQSASRQATAQNQQGINTAKLPEFFQTTDGRYYRKVEGNLTEIDYDQYMKLKHDNAVQQQKNAEASAKANAFEQQQKVNEAINKANAIRQKDEMFAAQVSNKVNQLGQNFQAGQRVNALKEDLKENNTLSGNYESLEQLDSEFNQKMANLNTIVSNLAAQKNEYLNSSVDLYFNDAQSQTYGEGVKLLGSMVNDISAANAKKKAQEQLRAQREAAALEIENKKREHLLKFRTELLSKFTNGSLPLSSSRINAQAVYYFVYSYNKAELGYDQPVLFVSNVFPIMQYADGTWPFKDKIMTEINGLTIYAELLDGHHIDKIQADSRREFLINKFKQSGGLVREVNYNGKLVSDNSTKNDFWENKKSDGPEQNTPKKAVDDFWAK